MQPASAQAVGVARFGKHGEPFACYRAAMRGDTATIAALHELRWQE
jgi:hypothetical protein